MDLSLPKEETTSPDIHQSPTSSLRNDDDSSQPADFPTSSSSSAILDLSRAAESSKPLVNLTEKLLDKAGEKNKNKKRQSSTPKRKPVNPVVKIKRLNLPTRPGGRKEDVIGSVSPGHSDADAPSDKPSYYYEDVCGIEEKWPGKTCILCCHNEKSQLGQGTILQMQATGPLLDAAPPEHQLQPVRKLDKLKALLMNDGQTHHLSELQEELCQVGYYDRPDPTQLLDTSDLYYIHQACSTWCKSQGDLEAHIVRALQQVCSFCGRFGASVSCKMAGCGKALHFPCAVASGAFMDLRTAVAHCSEHIHQGSAVAGSAGVCNTCSSPGHVGNLVYCVTCGKHFHGSCVGISTVSNVRTGWQCSDCRTCVACRNSGEEMKMLVCDTCDKVYHPFCVRPLLSNIPKTGWKCKNCRICGDCGSRAPGAGPSSRWHSCFTVCDSCYQQRNKGACCPICGKAYRYSSKEMSMCASCRKYVHSSCDMEADRTICQRRRDVNPDYEYVCSVCKAGAQASFWSQSSCENKGEEELDFSLNYNLSQESLGDDVFSEFEFSVGSEDKSPRPHMKGKPLSGSIQRKRLGPSISGQGRGFPRLRGNGRGGTPFMPTPTKPGGLPDIMRRRGFKGRMRSSLSSGLQRSSSDNLKDEETIGEHAIVLFSAVDEFVLHQDICVLCGCFGTDLEGRLVPCVQCGQCFHPYCAKIKLTKTMIMKGWRCFDCTICEGCGMKNDEARLILCDECDISFHIYCTDPPLDYVPSGGWKCKWCTICQNCGSNDPGSNGTWFNNFTLCAPCQSMTVCPQCNFNHTEGELILQCSQCDRWSHGKCDAILNEQDAERATADGYTCPLCRPAELTPSHVSSSLKGISPPSSPEPYRFKPSSDYFLDGIFLSESGMVMLRSQMPQELPSKRGRATLRKGRELEWDSNTSGQDCGLEPGENDAADESEVLKEGTVLSPKPDGRPPDVPDGYTLVPDNGKFIVKKKRQRNLHKLGIGGFQVRRPWARREANEEGFEVPLPAGMSPGHTFPGAEDLEMKKKRLQKRKQKNKISENYPGYIQEAFFGKEIMGPNPGACREGGNSTDSDHEGGCIPAMESTITLSQEIVSAIEAQKRRQGMADLVKQLKAEQVKSEMNLVKPGPSSNMSQTTATTPPTSRASMSSPTKRDSSDLSEDEGLHFDIPLPTDLDLDVDKLMNESDNLSRNSDEFDDPTDLDADEDSKHHDQAELCNIPSPHFSVDAIASEASLSGVDSKDVEDIFKGVLAEDEAYSNSGMDSENQTITLHGLGGQQFTQQVMSMENMLKVDDSLDHSQGSQQSNSHQDQQMTHQQLPFIDSFHGHWQQQQHHENQQLGVMGQEESRPPPSESETSSGGGSSRNNTQKWEAEEALGEGATISAVLYANLCQPDLKVKFPVWSERLKQIAKIWRALPSDQKTPYLQKARENRSANKGQRPPQSAQSKETKEKKTHPPSSNSSSSDTHSISPPKLKEELKKPPTEPLMKLRSLDRIPAPNVTITKEFSAKNVTIPIPPPPHHKPKPTPVLKDPLKPPEKTVEGDSLIRVLTPSEIMRTLPCLEQTSRFEKKETEPEQRQRRPETEQEQQWRQLQAARQQQQQSAAAIMNVAAQHSSHHPQGAIPGFAVAKGLAPLEQPRPAQTQHLMEMRLQALQDPKLRLILTQRGLTPVQIQQLIAQATASQGHASHAAHPPNQEASTHDASKHNDPRTAAHDIDHDADFADITMDDEDLLGLGSDFNILDYGAGAENFNILDYTDADLESHLHPPPDGTGQDVKKNMPQPIPLCQGHDSSDGGTIKLEPEVQNVGPAKVGSGNPDIYAQPPPPYRPPPPYPGTRPKEENLVLQNLLDQGTSQPQNQTQQEGLLSPQKPFLSDLDFEKLKADVLGGAALGLSPPSLPGIGHLNAVQHRIQQATQNLWGTGLQQQQQHQQGPQQPTNQPLPSMRPVPTATPAAQPQPTRQPIQFSLLPVPPTPSDNPQTPEEKQVQMNYEEWLGKQQELIKTYQSVLETEINKFRKQKKSLNSRQRQARKNGGELGPVDAAELERVTVEQNAIQKQLESIRRQAKQHTMHIQDYQSKQQKRLVLEDHGQENQQTSERHFSQNLQQLSQTQGGAFPGQVPRLSGIPQQVRPGQMQMVHLQQVPQRRPTPGMTQFQVPPSPQQSPMASPKQTLMPHQQSPMPHQMSPMSPMPHQMLPQSPMSQFPPHSPMPQRSPMMSNQVSPMPQMSPMPHQQSPMNIQSPMPHQSPMQPPYQQQSPLGHSPMQQMSPMQMMPHQSPLPHPSPLPEDSSSPSGASPYAAVQPSPSPNAVTSPYGNPAASPRLMRPSQSQIMEDASQRQGSPGVGSPQRPPSAVRQSFFCVDQQGNRIPIPPNIDPSRIHPALLQRFIRPVEGQRMRGMNPDTNYPAQGSPGQQPVRLMSQGVAQLRSPRPPMSPGINPNATTPGASPGGSQMNITSVMRRHQSGDLIQYDSAENSRGSGTTTPSEASVQDRPQQPGLTQEQYLLLQQRLAAHNQAQVQRFATRGPFPMQFQQRYIPPKSPGVAVSYQGQPKSPGINVPPQSPMAPPQSPAPAIRSQSPAFSGYPQSPAGMGVPRSPAPQLVHTPLQSPQFAGFSQQFAQSPGNVMSPRSMPPQSPVQMPAHSPLGNQEHLQLQQTVYQQQQQQDIQNGGGGRNPNILPAQFAHFRYSKPGLRGGSPMDSSSGQEGKGRTPNNLVRPSVGQTADQIPQSAPSRMAIPPEFFAALQQRRALEAQQRAQQAANQQAQPQRVPVENQQRFSQLSELLMRPSEEPKQESSGAGSQLSELLAKPVSDRVPPFSLNFSEKKSGTPSAVPVAMVKTEPQIKSEFPSGQHVLAQRTTPQVQGVVTPQMHRITQSPSGQVHYEQAPSVQGHMPVQRPGPVLNVQQQQQLAFAQRQTSAGTAQPPSDANAGPPRPVSQLPQPSPSEVASNQLFLQQLLQKSQGNQQQAENLVRMISQQPPAIQSQMIQRIRAAMTLHQTSSVGQPGLQQVRPPHPQPQAVGAAVQQAAPIQGQTHQVYRVTAPQIVQGVRPALAVPQTQSVRPQQVQFFQTHNRPPVPTAQPIPSHGQSLPQNHVRAPPLSLGGDPAAQANAHRVQEQHTFNAHLQQPVPLQKTVAMAEIKKEVMSTETSSGLNIKEEIPESVSSIKLELEDSLEGFDKMTGDAPDEKKALDLEKRRAKRREYQQKRRQQALLSRETGAESPSLPVNAPPAKKRPRKGTARQEEDYDVFIGGMMGQVRRLAPLTVTEPKIGRFSFNTLPYGTGDLNKLTFNFSDSEVPPWIKGDLEGELYEAFLPQSKPVYETKQFGGVLSPEPESPPSESKPVTPSPGGNHAPIQRGFYYHEFAAPCLGPEGYKRDHKQPVPDRDTDTPDSIVSTSSPECVLKDTVPQFPGLKVISEDEAGDDSTEEGEERPKRLPSPPVPLLAPIPIKPEPKPIKVEENKENDGLAREKSALQARFGLQTPPLRDSSNVTVTLTLNASAAENITGVLGRLAALLGCAAPAEYEIVERTVTPPSQKVGLYRTKSKDGKEESVDVQSLLQGGNAKFCRHCDMVIIGEAVSKKTTDFPGLKWEQMWPNSPAGEELLFCGTTCYAQFGMTNKMSAAETRPLKEETETSTVAPDPIVCKSSAALSDIVSALTGTLDPKQFGLKHLTEGIQIPMPEVSPSGEKKKDVVEATPPPKKKQGKPFLTWSETFAGSKKYKKPTENELMEMLYRQAICLVPPQIVRDNRRCLFCLQDGDAMPDGPGRLVNYDVDRWVHVNCAIWAEDTYETPSGVLMNVDVALKNCLNLTCTVCEQPGAAVKCQKVRCGSTYHIGCAVKEKAVFYRSKTVFCSEHASKGEKEDQLTTLAVFRRIVIQRDESRQVASVMQHAEPSHLFRIGSTVVLSLGQLLPHQLAAFHTPHHIYPVGYKVLTIYWSFRVSSRKCRYYCTIEDKEGRPYFSITVSEPEKKLEDLHFSDWTPTGAWQRILNFTEAARYTSGGIRFFPKYVSGEDLFGLTEPAIVRVLESLPGVESLNDYNVKYGRNPILELPLAVNPTGCARAEPKLRMHFKRVVQRAGGSLRSQFALTSLPSSESPYSKQFLHSKSSQYKKMKAEGKTLVYLARSKIQGLGLYALRDIEKHTMIIEYIGEIIRNAVAESREKRYEAQNRGIYMFRIDDERVVDASMSGGLARFINHCCNPNCTTELVEVDRDLKIIIFANRRIVKGEELAYDYKFDLEDDKDKIPCLCGAPNCRKWMN